MIRGKEAGVVEGCRCKYKGMAIHGWQIQTREFVIKCRTADMQLYVSPGALSGLAKSAAGYRGEVGFDVSTDRPSA